MMNPGNFRHGHNRRDHTTPTYQSWAAMVSRPRHKVEYIGITIDPRWHRFENFLADMGERPPGTTIDRINNDLGYSKENCRWATPEQQTRNRKIAIRAWFCGEYLPLAEIAKRVGTTWKALHHRHVAGSLQAYLDGGQFDRRKPAMGMFRGSLMSLRDIHKATGISYQTLYKWMKKGMLNQWLS